MSDHRKPPKPASWNVPRGNCRFCGEEIVEAGKVNKRKNWHADCAHTWKVMNDPYTAREHVLRRDKRTCQVCRVKGKDVKFEVDHIRPLFEANGDATCWQPENLILLCRPCHVTKTRIDMTRYREKQAEATKPK